MRVDYLTWVEKRSGDCVSSQQPVWSVHLVVLIRPGRRVTLQSCQINHGSSATQTLLNVWPPRPARTGHPPFNVTKRKAEQHPKLRHCSIVRADYSAPGIIPAERKRGRENKTSLSKMLRDQRDAGHANLVGLIQKDISSPFSASGGIQTNTESGHLYDNCVVFSQRDRIRTGPCARKSGPVYPQQSTPHQFPNNHMLLFR